MVDFLLFFLLVSELFSCCLLFFLFLRTHLFFLLFFFQNRLFWTQEDRPSTSTRKSSLMELLFHMSSHVRDVITLFLFILVILFLWPLMSISSLTWLWGAFVNDYALFFHIGLVTLEHLVLWLEISTSVNLSKADSTFGIRLSRMAMQERLRFPVFPYVFEISQPDFTRKDVTVNGVLRTCPELTGYLLIFLWLRHVIFIAILMSSKILVNVPSRGFAASSCPILRVTCRHVLRKEGKHEE